MCNQPSHHLHRHASASFRIVAPSGTPNLPRIDGVTLHHGPLLHHRHRISLIDGTASSRNCTVHRAPPDGVLTFVVHPTTIRSLLAYHVGRQLRICCNSCNLPVNNNALIYATTDYCIPHRAVRLEFTTYIYGVIPSTASYTVLPPPDHEQPAGAHGHKHGA